MSSNREYIRVISNDSFEFYLDRVVANQCPYLEERLRKIDKSMLVDIATILIPEVRGEILEIIIQYLNTANSQAMRCLVSQSNQNSLLKF